MSNLEFIRKFIYTTTFWFFSLWPIKNNKIFIEQHYGQGYGDNPKYIVEKLLENKKKYEIYWTINSKTDCDFPKEVNLVKRRSLAFFYHLTTSKIWIDNFRKSRFVKKRKKQVYIQTWHGNLGFKKIEKDVEEFLPKNYILDAKHDSEMMDYLISGSKWFSDMAKNAFWFNGPIINTGIPRNDIFFQNQREIIEKVKKNLGISQGKVILYAPTFRKNGSIHPYSLKFDKIKSMLRSYYNDEVTLLIRLHPNIRNKVNELNINTSFIDATNYPDMQELLCTADVLLTDYSSCIFDFMLSEKPAFLIALDHEDYLKIDTPTNFSLEDLPLNLAKTNEELLKNIMLFNLEDYKKKIKDFYQKSGNLDNGNAANNVIKLIDNIIGT